MVKKKEEIDVFCPINTQEWREWLQRNHDKKKSVWLVYYKKEANMPTISWSDAVNEALCFGWIDSIKKSIDDKKFMQFFSRRKAYTTWSKVNKEKVKSLIASQRMTEAGFRTIEIAKQNGSWSILDEVEELIIPIDLEKEFEKRINSKEFFLSLSKSNRKVILQWIVLAKQQETRYKRIVEIADLASKKMKPKQLR